VWFEVSEKWFRSAECGRRWTRSSWCQAGTESERQLYKRISWRHMPNPFTFTRLLCLDSMNVNDSIQNNELRSTYSYRIYIIMNFLGMYWSLGHLEGVSKIEEESA
jgi:hypothetical protein